MTSLREFLSLPTGAGPNSRLTGDFDEFGRPIHGTPIGQDYTMRETQPVGPREAITQAAGAFRDDPLAATKNTLRALVQGAWNGVEAPGNALRGIPQTYGDVADTALDWGVMSAVGRAPQGALRSGAMLDDAAETPAQTVSRLLREGRASEVTDDLMAQVDPQEMARLYEGGATGMDMPLDEASRMARAQEMGFDTDTPLMHGTTRDFTAFNPEIAPRQVEDPGLIGRAIYTTESPATANLYASMNWRNENLGAQHYPVMSRAQNPFVSQDGVLPAGRDFQDYHPQGLSVEGGARWRSDLQDAGHDAITFRTGDQATQHVVFDPRNIRSRFARFDPRLSHLTNLSAGIGAGGIMLHQQDREADMQRLAAYLAENGGL